MYADVKICPESDSTPPACAHELALADGAPMFCHYTNGQLLFTGLALSIATGGGCTADAPCICRRTSPDCTSTRNLNSNAACLFWGLCVLLKQSSLCAWFFSWRADPRSLPPLPALSYPLGTLLSDHFALFGVFRPHSCRQFAVRSVGELQVVPRGVHTPFRGMPR